MQLVIMVKMFSNGMLHKSATQQCCYEKQMPVTKKNKKLFTNNN